ncbi:hypothetical protein AB4402_10155 [Vibrio breoganii]
MPNSNIEAVKQDIKTLKLILNLDFLTNLLSLAILFSSPFLVLGFFEDNQFFALLCTLIVAVYTCTKYYGDSLDRMHKLPLEAKPFTHYLAKKHQKRLCKNFKNNLMRMDLDKENLDSWEAEKISLYLKTDKLDNPTAFLIFDIYERHVAMHEALERTFKKGKLKTGELDIAAVFSKTTTMS